MHSVPALANIARGLPLPLLLQGGIVTNVTALPGGNAVQVYIPDAIRMVPGSPLTVSWTCSVSGPRLPVAFFQAFQFNGLPPPPPSPPSPPPPPPLP